MRNVKCLAKHIVPVPDDGRAVERGPTVACSAVRVQFKTVVVKPGEGCQGRSSLLRRTRQRLVFERVALFDERLAGIGIDNLLVVPRHAIVFLAVTIKAPE